MGGCWLVAGLLLACCIALVWAGDLCAIYGLFKGNAFELGPGWTCDKCHKPCGSSGKPPHPFFYENLAP